MYSKISGTLCVLFGMIFSVSAQDCTLNIGKKNTETIIKIFQLNEEQIATMENLRSELEIETKSIEDTVRKLLDAHPQSTPTELNVLADKYKVLQQKMVNVSKATDKKFITTFNERQYQRYLSLCNEAFRKPIQVIPTPQKNDSLSPK